MPRAIMLFLMIVAQLANIIAVIRMIGYILVGSDKGKGILLAYDRLGNAAIGGSDRETISSRANRGRLAGVRRWCLLCRFLGWLDKNHCEKSAGT